MKQSIEALRSRDEAALPRNFLTQSNFAPNLPAHPLTPFLNLTTDVANLIDVQMDIDSVLWTGYRLPISHDVAIHPSPNRNATLTLDNGIRVELRDKDTGEHAHVPLHHIPNFRFATCGRYHLLVFFPHARRQDTRTSRHINYCTAAMYAAWYERVVLPALAQLRPPDRLQHYPISYQAADAQAFAASGLRDNSSYIIPAAVVPLLATQFRVLESQLPPSMREFFFHVYAKDLKLSLSSHDFPDILFFWDSTLNIFDIGRDCGKDEFIFDIGVEYTTEEGGQLLWNGRHLERMLQSSAWVERSIDKWCGHPEIFGIRAAPSRHIVRQCGLLKLQAYFCDKEAVYSKRRRTCTLAMGPEDVKAQNSKYFQQISYLRDVWASTASTTTTYGVRFEVRASHRATVLLANGLLWNASALLLEMGCLWKVSSADVCAWKMARLDALAFAARQSHRKFAQVVSGPRRRDKSYVQRMDSGRDVYAQCLFWLMQNLLSRPQDSSAGRIPAAVLSFGTSLPTSSTSVGRSGVVFAFPDRQLSRDCSVFVPTARERVEGLRNRPHRRRQAVRSCYFKRSTLAETERRAILHTRRRPRRRTQHVSSSSDTEADAWTYPSGLESEREEQSAALPDHLSAFAHAAPRRSTFVNVPDPMIVNPLIATPTAAAAAIFAKFLDQVWSLLPAPSLYLQPNTTFPLDPPPTTLVGARAVLKPFHARLGLPCKGNVPKKGRRLMTWRQEFCMYLGIGNMAGSKQKWSQGWQRLTYGQDLAAFRLSKGRQEIAEFDDELWRLFDTLEILPAASPTSKLWLTTKKGPQELGTSLQFVVNGSKFTSL